MRLSKEDLYRQNHETPGTEARIQRGAEAQAEIDRLKAEFFARGGKIKICASGESALEPIKVKVRSDGLKSL